MSQLTRIAYGCALVSVLAMGCSNSGTGNAASDAQPTQVATKAPAQSNVATPPPPPPPPAPEKPKPMRIVKTWNFQELEKPHWQWDFPKVGTLETDQGAFYHVHASGPGPQLTPLENLKASEISAVRMHLRVMRKGEDVEKPESVEIPRTPLLLWASPEDVEVEGWVFSDSKRRAFEQLNPDNPYLFQADMRGRDDWTGEIARLAVTVPVPEDLDESEQPYSVFIRRIEFLK